MHRNPKNEGPYLEKYKVLNSVKTSRIKYIKLDKFANFSQYPSMVLIPTM